MRLSRIIASAAVSAGLIVGAASSAGATSKIPVKASVLFPVPTPLWAPWAPMTPTRPGNPKPVQPPMPKPATVPTVPPMVPPVR